LPTLLVLSMLPSVRLRLNLKLMLSMVLMDMVVMVLDAELTLLAMVALDTTVDTPTLAMDVDSAMEDMDMASALLMLNLRLMLFMVLMDMVDMVLNTELTLLDMVALDTTVDTPPLVMDVESAMEDMDMASALLMLSLRLMLYMVLMDMEVLDTELTLLAMVALDTTVDTLPLAMDVCLAMDMVLAMPTMDMENKIIVHSYKNKCGISMKDDSIKVYFPGPVRQPSLYIEMVLNLFFLLYQAQLRLRPSPY
jgi:hypothetical protein